MMCAGNVEASPTTQHNTATLARKRMADRLSDEIRTSIDGRREPFVAIPAKGKVRAGRCHADLPGNPSPGIGQPPPSDPI
jgi:hypothetical protein